MVRRFFIVVGDTTTAGGEALTGAPHVTIQSLSGDQRPQAFVGDQVLCGQCGLTTISSGISHVTINGRNAAVDGSALTCGHALVSTQQRLSWIEDDTGSGSEPGYARSGGGERWPAAAIIVGNYDEAFVLRSQATGKPLANRRYGIVRGESVETGVTDSHGKTHVVVSDTAEEVEIHVQEEGP